MRRVIDLYISGVHITDRPSDFADIMEDVIEILGTSDCFWAKSKPSHKRDGRGKYDSLVAAWCEMAVLSKQSTPKKVKPIEKEELKDGKASPAKI